MQNRLSSIQNTIVKSRKVTPPLKEPKKISSKSEGPQKKNSQLPLKTAAEKPKKTSSKSEEPQKKSSQLPLKTASEEAKKTSSKSEEPPKKSSQLPLKTPAQEAKKTSSKSEEPPKKSSQPPLKTAAQEAKKTSSKSEEPPKNSQLPLKTAAQEAKKPSSKSEEPPKKSSQLPLKTAAQEAKKTSSKSEEPPKKSSQLPLKTAAQEAKKTSSKSEEPPKKSSQLPLKTGAEQSRAASVNSKSSTLSTYSKKATVNTVLAKPVTQKKPIPSLPSAPNTREDLKQLGAQFGKLSSSILLLATSQIPVGVRSLESLLNREVSKSLGDGVNHPQFSQGFIQATRALLENLISVHEGGRLNPKLLKDRTREDKSFIRANSTTTVCYRDRYFKELVMNTLQSMTSCEMEEEVTIQAAHSEESRERIQVIRDMVRAEAGLEPEDFRQLEQQLHKLKMSLTKNKLEMEKATLEVDKIISQHTVKQATANDLQIPKPAREALRAFYNKGVGSASGFSKSGFSACENENVGCKQISYFRDTAVDGKEQYKKSLNIIGEDKGDSDEIQNIRPHLKHLVQEELLRIKMKEEEILSQDRQFHRINRLEDTPNSSLESVEYKSAASNFSGDEDDEISQEESHHFLQALKAEIEERNVNLGEVLNCGPQGCCVKVLERIDEDEGEINYQEDSDISTSDNTKPSSSFMNPSSVNLVPSECFDEILNAISDHSICNLEASGKNMIERVKSKWIIKENSEVNILLPEMKNIFEVFKITSDDDFNSLEINKNDKKETGKALESKNLTADKGFYLSDFTVEEVANVLVNISIKINSLPNYLQEIASNNSLVQKEQAFVILSDLGESLNASHLTESDDIEDLNEVSLSLPNKKVAKAFSLLSNTLQSSPVEIKSKSISVLSPPKTLVETLNALSSTVYFRDCFTSVKENLGKQTKTTRNIDAVKPDSINQQRSSGEMLTFNLVNNSSFEDKYGGCRRKLFTFTRDIKNPGDLDKNLANFEHFMGLTASVMTVQNVSDMFLYLSTVLNDVPERLKSEKVLELNPPASLLNALNILYIEDKSDSVTELDKIKSFASLTIQNVSDFLLTLSKTFDDVPDRLKDSIVAELKPPSSLLRAITLLTSLSYFSIPECYSKEVEEEYHEETLSNESQETFFDGVGKLV